MIKDVQSNQNSNKKITPKFFSDTFSLDRFYTSQENGAKKASALDFIKLIRVRKKVHRVFKSFGYFSRAAAAGITLVKAVNASGGINQFLFSGKKRVTFRTNFNLQVFAHCRARLKTMSARTGNGNFVVFRMYFWFHYFISRPLVLLFRIKCKPT